MPWLDANGLLPGRGAPGRPGPPGRPTGRGPGVPDESDGRLLASGGRGLGWCDGRLHGCGRGLLLGRSGADREGAGVARDSSGASATAAGASTGAAGGASAVAAAGAWGA